MSRRPLRPFAQAAFRLFRGPLVLFLGLVACATPTKLSSYQRSLVELRFKGHERELATSMYVAPFYRDSSRRLLTVAPPMEVVLLMTPDGKPIFPGPAQEVLPAGTRVTILDVNFPTRWSNLTRPLFTPSDRPWVEVAVAGRPASLTYVLPIRPDVKSDEDVAQEIGKFLTRDDVAGEISKLPAADQLAIRTKRLVTGVSTKALLLAFGTPNQRNIYGQGTHVAEDWSWESDTGVVRQAHVEDGKVTRVAPPKTPPARASPG